MPRQRYFILTVVSFLAWHLAGLPATVSAAKARQIILITIDAMRADHSPCYGYDRNTTPVLDKLSRQGVIFSDVISPIPRTTQGLACLMTGLSPTSSGVRGMGTPLNSSLVMLAEIFARQGFETAAFVNHPVDLLTKLKFSTGFQTSKKSNKPVTEAKQWIASHSGKKFFLWVHLFDPHWPYKPPSAQNVFSDPGYLSGHAEEYANYTKETRGTIVFHNDWPQDAREHAKDLYDGEIRSADAQTGDLLRFIAAHKKLNKAAVIITADHGEGSGEHNYFFEHGEVLYDNLLRVPLVIFGKRVTLHPAVVTTPVTLMDIFPTILDLAKIKKPKAIEGISLLPQLQAKKYAAQKRQGEAALCFGETDISHFKENPRYFIPNEGGRWKMVRTPEYKLIKIPHQDSVADEYEFYDLNHDPAERENIFSPNDRQSVKFKELLNQWIQASEAIRAKRSNEASPALDEQMQEALKTLGYIN